MQKIEMHKNNSQTEVSLCTGEPKAKQNLVLKQLR
jgi:hypothetical protein